MSDDNDDSWPPDWRGLFRGFEEVERIFEEMQRDFFPDLSDPLNLKGIPPNLIRKTKLPTGEDRDEIGPIVYGYSVTMGPDGKPIVNQFGNVNPSAPGATSPLSDKREPLIDVMNEASRIRVIAEIAGAERETIRTTVSPDGMQLTITAANADRTRQYEKTVALPVKVASNVIASMYNNGILEVLLPKV